MNEKDREKIVRLREIGLTYAAIGAQFGVSHEWIRQILKKEQDFGIRTWRKLTGGLYKIGLKPYKIKTKPCHVCGRTENKKPHAHICDSCRFMTKTCGECGKSITRDLYGPNGKRYHRTRIANIWYCPGHRSLRGRSHEPRHADL